METLNIRNNYNGKIFCDNFSELLIASPQYIVGYQMQLMQKNTEMGIVQIEAVRLFPFARVSDVVSFLNCGKPAAAQAEILNRQYAGPQNKLAPDTIIAHVVFSYIERNIQNHGLLLQDWWESKQPETQNS